MSRFTIALSGLAQADAAMFTAALDAMPDSPWKLVESTPAALLVVDIDSVWGHMDWLRATASGQRVVAFSRDGQVRGCDLVLHKPLHANELATLLQSVEDVPDHRAPAAAPSSDDETAGAEPAAEPVAVEIPAPAPEPAVAMTLGECLLADRISHPVTIKGADGIELILDPERGGYTGSSTLKPLEPLLDIPMTEARPLDAAAIEQIRQAPAMPLTRLLWFAALSASPGRLAPTLDAHATYHLARWPQIEREFPRHFRIATAMMKGPGTLGDIASAANAPVADVADFINAYSVAGYVASDSESNPAADATGAHTGGMFSRLRRPFSRSGQEPA